MAATPFKGTLYAETVVSRAPVFLRFSASDVALANVTWDDYGAIAPITIPVSSGGWRIKDLTLSAAGVDTTSLQFFRGIQASTVFFRGAFAANTTTTAATRVGPAIDQVLGAGETYFLKQLA